MPTSLPWRKPWVGSWFSQNAASSGLGGGGGRVVGDQHGLGVPGLAAAHLLVRRVGGEAAHVAGGGRHDPGQPPEDALRAPEAAHGDVQHSGALGPRAVQGGAEHLVRDGDPRQRLGPPGQGGIGGGQGLLRGESEHAPILPRGPRRPTRAAQCRPCRSMSVRIALSPLRPSGGAAGRGRSGEQGGEACPTALLANPPPSTTSRAGPVSPPPPSRGCCGARRPARAETHARVLAAARDLSYRPIRRPRLVPDTPGRRSGWSCPTWTAPTTPSSSWAWSPRPRRWASTWCCW